LIIHEWRLKISARTLQAVVERKSQIINCAWMQKDTARNSNVGTAGGVG